MTRHIIDLTMTLEENMQTFNAPWHPKVAITQLGYHGREHRETRKLVLGTHTGTHIDAPRHFIENGVTVDSLPLDLFVGPATLLNFSHAKPKQQLEIDDLKNALGDLNCKRLVLRFDWDKHFNSASYYQDHPYLSQQAAAWLVENGCCLLAMDTPQPDNPLNGYNTPNDAIIHKILLGSGVILVEYLINLHMIKQLEFNLIVAPLKIKDGDGAPARCFAIEDN